MGQNKKLFIIGISTVAVKTIVSFFIVEALEAAYWKSIQAGGCCRYLDNHKIKSLISNDAVIIQAITIYKYVCKYTFSAAIDEVIIELQQIAKVYTNNYLPLERRNFISDSLPLLTSLKK